jgi:transposase-like protein
MAIAMDKRETEVAAKAQRRRFTAEYKLQVLAEADRCRAPGELGALLRREGLYSSHLTNWRAARRQGERAGLSSQRRGPKPRIRDERDARIEALEAELKRWRGRAELAETLVEVQKKVSTLLGIDLGDPSEKP